MGTLIPTIPSSHGRSNLGNDSVEIEAPSSPLVGAQGPQDRQGDKELDSST